MCTDQNRQLKKLLIFIFVGILGTSVKVKCHVNVLTFVLVVNSVFAVSVWGERLLR